MSSPQERLDPQQQPVPDAAAATAAAGADAELADEDSRNLP